MKVNWEGRKWKVCGGSQKENVRWEKPDGEVCEGKVRMESSEGEG